MIGVATMIARLARVHFRTLTMIARRGVGASGLDGTVSWVGVLIGCGSREQ
jgi:hypothetical protein